MNILLASSEVYPYSKTGGLADMTGALAKSLAAAGRQVSIVSPLYLGVEQKAKGLKLADDRLRIQLGTEEVPGRLWSLAAAPNLTLWFVDQPDFFHRHGLYQENGADYPDNAERFIFFTKAVRQLAARPELKIDILHLHDWQVALAAMLVHHDRTRGTLTPGTCLTIHNLAYQGNFPPEKYHLLNLPWDYFTAGGAEFYAHLNFLKGGLVFADVITTVSPRYAREIMTEPFGCGLDGVLRARQKDLFGVLNGVDYSEWNTTNNPHLATSFTAEDLAGKQKQKEELQKEFGLAVAPATPLFGTVSRLVDQKGVDIQLAALEEMLACDMQFVLLGTGHPLFENAFKKLAARHPGKVGVKIGYDHGLAHRIEAGCDFFIMPSRFEPCGLNQLYSLRYGTIPIVRVTGGLDDSVVDISENVERADGIKFYAYSARALTKAIRKALVIHRDPELLNHYRQNGMTSDFSWDATRDEYLRIYERALEKSRPGST